MKTDNQKNISELTAGFDNELKKLLMEDIKAIRSAGNKIANVIKQGLNQNSLTAA